MLEIEDGESHKPRERVKVGKDPIESVSLTPTDRLHNMTRERVETLEDDNKRLLSQVEQYSLDTPHQR